jgi:hypothetical protein
MRLFFWASAATGFLLLLFGVVLGDIPMFMDVDGADIRLWYQDQMTSGAVIGLLLGSLSAIAAIVVISHRPREHSGAFASRVAGWGFVTLLVAAAVIVAWGWNRGYSFSLIPEAASERASRLVANSKFMAVLGMCLITSSVSFALISRVYNWGGRYALVKPYRVSSTLSRRK